MYLTQKRKRESLLMESDFTKIEQKVVDHLIKFEENPNSNFGLEAEDIAVEIGATESEVLEALYSLENKGVVDRMLID